MKTTLPHRSLVALIAAAALLVHARAALPVPSLTEEQIDSGHVAYTLTNPTGAAFDITLFAVSGLSPQSPLAPAGWSAQVLALADWSLPIGGVSTNPSWERFTGTAFTSVFDAAASVTGYYVTFAADASGHWTYIPQEPLKPGGSLAGFSRAGTVASEFIAAGPGDSSTFIGDANDDPTQGVTRRTGTATVVPEPTSLLLLLVGAALFLCRRTLSPA